METKRFRKNDDGYTSRNHCPYCLSSLHLDVNPGDRASDCGGIMDPVKAEPDPRHGFVIYHRCRKCGAVKRNRAALDPRGECDNMDLLIELTSREL